MLIGDDKLQGMRLESLPTDHITTGLRRQLFGKFELFPSFGLRFHTFTAIIKRRRAYMACELF